MKVALLVGRFGPGTGTGGVAWRLAAGLRDRGHRLWVACARVDAELDGVEVAPLGDRGTAARRAPRGYVRYGLDRVPGCEVVRASGGVHAVWRRTRGGWRPDDLWESWLERRAILGARRVVCNSLLAAGEVRARYGIAASRVALIRTGATPSDRSERDAVRARWGVPPEGRAVLFLGHGFRRKNVAVALDAFALAAGPADRLILAGSEARPERWVAAGRERLGPRLVQLGAAPLAECLAGADVLLHPTRYDAASNAVLEAMASGVPVVVSARDGAAELVPDRRLVVGDPSDVKGFGAALRYAWDTPLGSACAAALRDWPDSRMVTATEHLLQETTDG